MSYGLVVFASGLVVVGIVNLLAAKHWGAYASNAWRQMGAEALAKTPTFWTKFSTVFGFMLIALGVMLLVFGLLNLR